MRKLIAAILNLLIRWADESVPVEELQRRILSAFEILIRKFRVTPDDFSEAARIDLIDTAKNLLAAGLIPSLPKDLPDEIQTEATRLSLARTWRSQLPENKVLVKSAFAPGSGKMLDVLDEFGNNEEKAFVGAALETLLRHVEVKRKKCLSLTQPEINAGDLFLERQRITLLFCHAAENRGDYRFLNAAFKLNDWSLRNLKPQLQSITGLCAQIHALAAAEAVAKEMLR